MTNAVVQLVKGTRTLDLDSGRYTVGEKFVPSPLNLVPQLSGGSSANRYGGEMLTGSSAHNREWSFGIGISGASDWPVSTIL